MAKPSTPASFRGFRENRHRPKIHPHERLLVVILSAHLVFLSWAEGSLRIWCALACVGLSTTEIVVALHPRHDDQMTDPGVGSYRLDTAPKLVRFPIFWLGIIFFAYIVLQALNPARRFVSFGAGWWMQPIAYVKWLPTGIRSPFERGGPWRMLIVEGSSWLTVCAMWIGLTRRKALRTLFVVIAANGFALAVLGLAEKATKTKQMFWLWRPPWNFFVSSFTYKNHAGAYFDLLFSLCVGLSVWYYRHSKRNHERSGPSGVFAFFAAAISLTVCFSYSRTAILLLCAYIVAVSVIAMWQIANGPSSAKQHPVITFGTIALFATFILIGFESVGTGGLVSHFSELRDQLADTKPGPRTLVHSATWDMFRAKPMFGWGAGSFSFLFPLYQQFYPQIFTQNGVRLVWEHAYNDYLEGLAEVGIFGGCIVGAAVAYGAFRSIKARLWCNPLSLAVMGGAVLTLLHNTVDFNFFNPPILTTWWVLFFGVIRWAELDHNTSERRASC